MASEFEFPPTRQTSEPEGYEPNALDLLHYKMQGSDVPERAYEVIARTANNAAALRDVMVQLLALVKIAESRGVSVDPRQGEFAALLNHFRPLAEGEKALNALIHAANQLTIAVVDAGGLRVTHEHLAEVAKAMGYPVVKQLPRDRGLPPSLGTDTN